MSDYQLGDHHSPQSIVRDISPESVICGVNMRLETGSDIVLMSHMVQLQRERPSLKISWNRGSNIFRMCAITDKAVEVAQIVNATKLAALDVLTSCKQRKRNYQLQSLDWFCKYGAQNNG